MVTMVRSAVEQSRYLLASFHTSWIWHLALECLGTVGTEQMGKGTNWG